MNTLIDQKTKELKHPSHHSGHAERAKFTICMLHVPQLINDAISKNLHVRMDAFESVAPMDPVRFVKENQSRISLAVLGFDTTADSGRHKEVVDLLDIFRSPYIIIDDRVRLACLANALKGNSLGYLTYNCPLNSLVDTLSNLASGKIKQYWCPEASEHIDSSGRRLKLNSQSGLSLLTARQLEVLSHLAEGKTVKEVGQILHLSHKSVDSHKYRIMNRLNIHDRVHLSRIAIREGLIDA